MTTTSAGKVHIGWAGTDITPAEPVQVAGQFHVRISEGVMDPVTATALALSSGDHDPAHAAILVSCDLVSVPFGLLEAVRERVREGLPEIDPRCVCLNATHTHTAPQVALPSDYERLGGGASVAGIGVELPAMDPADYVAFAAERIAAGVVTAWRDRRPGRVGYGLGHAVVGRNRRSVYAGGESRMYGDTGVADFSHIEGHEDHGVNVLATWDAQGVLTGVVVIPGGCRGSHGRGRQGARAI